MKILIDLDEDVYVTLFDNGVELSKEDNEVLQTAIRKGLTEDYSELHKAVGYNEGYTQALKDTLVSQGGGIDMSKNWWETEVEYRNTLQQILDSGILTYEHEIDALEYAILLIQKEIDGEVD